MNAKQRRRLVRQYAEKVQLDRVAMRLEGRVHWFDSARPNPRYLRQALVTDAKKARLDYIYTRFIQSQENDSCSHE